MDPLFDGFIRCWYCWEVEITGGNRSWDIPIPPPHIYLSFISSFCRPWCESQPSTTCSLLWCSKDQNFSNSKLRSVFPHPTLFSQVFCKRDEKLQWAAPTLSSIDDHFLWWTTLPSTRCSCSHKLCEQRIWYNMCSHALKSLFTGFWVPEFSCFCYHLQPWTKAGADFWRHF